MKLGEYVRRSCAAIVLAVNTGCFADTEPRPVLPMHSPTQEIAATPTQTTLPPTIKQFLKTPGIWDWRTGLERSNQVLITDCDYRDAQFPRMEGKVESLRLRTHTLPDQDSPLGPQSTWYKKDDRVTWKLEVAIETLFPKTNTQHFEQWALVEENRMPPSPENPLYLFSLIQRRTIASESEGDPNMEIFITPGRICQRETYGWNYR